MALSRIRRIARVLRFGANLQLPALLRANQSYQGAFEAPLDTPRPFGNLVILTCMDARLDLFRALGLVVGQAHVLRNAGGRASDDAIRSLLVSTHLLGTREIGVIHHTNCGLGGVTDEDVARATGVQDVAFLAFATVEDRVREDVKLIRSCGQFPHGVMVWGAVYDVDTGAVRVLEEPQPA